MFSPKPTQFQKFIQKIENGQLAKGLPLIRFGKGPQKLVIFPGISDAFLPIASSMPQYIPWYYRRYARDYDVCVISRKRGLPAGYTTRDIARDHAAAALLAASNFAVRPSTGIRSSRNIVSEAKPDTKPMTTEVLCVSGNTR